MICIVRFPEKINSKNKELYRKSLEVIYNKLLLPCNELTKIVAVGHEEYRAFWKGENWINQTDFSEHLFLQNGDEHILVAGLDAPFISVDTFRLFFKVGGEHEIKSIDAPICTFRKTPDQQNIAAMESGGKVICIVSYLNGNPSLNMQANGTNPDEQEVALSVLYPDNTLEICSDSSLQFILSDSDRKNQKHWDSSSSAQDFCDSRIYYSRENDTVRISFHQNCMLQIIKNIQAPGLYSRIHYGYTAVAVDGIIGVDENQNRTNLKNSQKITGRQSFPELYEPIEGLVLLKRSELEDFLEDNENWFKKQKKIRPVMVDGRESKLISQDNIFIISDWDKI